MNYETLKLEKGMYAVPGKNFTQVLEQLDPTANYGGTPLAGLDAYQRQLKRFDIKVAGAGSDAVQKFFQTSDSAALFPEYIARAVRQGMEEADVLGDVVATTTNIDSLDYRTITSVPTESQKEMNPVEEGAAIPSTQVKLQENLVTLKKRGRMLEASYEAIKFQKLDLFTVTLRQIGAYLSKTLLKDAVTVLVSGDGNENPAEVVAAATAGKLTYDDLLTLWSKFDPYELNTLLVPPEVMLKMLSIAEFKDPLTGLNFQATGKLSTPLGASLIKTTAVPSGKIVALDRRCALEMVKASDVLIEYDKLIDKQLSRAAITAITGFAKIFTEASKVMTV